MMAFFVLFLADRTVISQLEAGMAKRSLAVVAELGEKSDLKADLNRGVALLRQATESHFRPHVCLNGEDGMQVLKLIAAKGANADTGWYLHPLVNVDVGRIWLNVRLLVNLSDRSNATQVLLSPQQTAHLVRTLPPASQAIILKKVREWYKGQFVKEMKEGLAALAKQFESDTLLVDDYFNGRVFDIHTKRDVPYTECLVVGEELYWKFLAAGTCFESSEDLLDKADVLIETARARQRSAVDTAIGVLRSTSRV
jgi:hypothetical protein